RQRHADGRRHAGWGIGARAHAVLPGTVDLRRHRPSAAEHHRRTRPRTSQGTRPGARHAVQRAPHQSLTELLYLRDADLGEFTATVTAVDDARVALDQTAFYATGGGQPHDTGTIDGVTVVDVRKEGDDLWHTLGGPAPAVGARVECVVDWDRRHQLMRTHS